MVVDKGYHSREVVRELEETGVRTYISGRSEADSAGLSKKQNDGRFTGIGGA